MTQQLTTNLQLPYYQGSDPADGASQQQALAERLDLVFAGRIPVSASAAAPILDVGMANQIRAGRQLTVADFTGLGLSQPIGLFNLSGLTNLGSGGTALSNKNTVLFAPGVNGIASTAAQFRGASGVPANDPALYIPDDASGTLPGAAFRIKTGSWGCWFRTAKRGAGQTVLAKMSTAAGQWAFELSIGGSNVLVASVSTTGSDLPTATGVSDVADDRWHFAVGTNDGTTLRLYIDGVVEASAAAGIGFAATAPLNIGARAADASTAASNSSYGRVDEAFVTADVLTEDQIRCLYAAKLTHTLGVTPTGVRLNVHRYRKGAALAVADFTTQPIRLHNFTAGALTDQGSGNVALTNNGAAISVAGADGTPGGAFSFPGAAVYLGATDAGLPAGTATRSYGCWFKRSATGFVYLMKWGTAAMLMGQADGRVSAYSGADEISGPFLSDGQWHFAVVVEDNAAGDGVRRKFYVDGRLVGGSTVMNAITLGGANQFSVGAAASSWVGQIDAAFVTGYALTLDDVLRLWAKGTQDLGASPKNPGDHVERLDASSVLFVGDTLESQHTVDLGVVA